MLQNITKILKSPIWIIWFIIWVLLIAIPSYFFTNKHLVIWNLWLTFYRTEIILTVIITILFWLFLWATLYKIQFFSIKKSWVWFIWWILWVIVSGCPACSITLASYIGLAWIISILPYHWLELKVLAIFFLLYANYSTLKNLEVCKVKKFFKK